MKVSLLKFEPLNRKPTHHTCVCPFPSDRCAQAPISSPVSESSVQVLPPSCEKYIPPTLLYRLPPAAQPTFLFRNSICRIGHGAFKTRPLQVAPLSVVRCSHPATSGEISPPPVQPISSDTNAVGPSKTSSAGGAHDQLAPVSALVQNVMPEA